MILPGRSIIPGIFGNVRSAMIQAHPCGMDLTLKRIKTRTSPGSVDFDNSLRRNASTVEGPFTGQHEQLQNIPAQFHLTLFDDPPMFKKHMETVDTPLSSMGQIFVRGAVGAMLHVMDPHGLLLFRDARLAQMVFHQESEPVEGYSGILRVGVHVRGGSLHDLRVVALHHSAVIACVFETA